jgi:hypothetical protein
MIKRSDGTTVGRSPDDIKKSQEERRAQQETKVQKTLRIEDLVPYESSIVTTRLAEVKNRPAAERPRPRVVDVDGCLMVLDGTHRVRAAIDAGEAEIEVTIETCLEKDRDRYSATLRVRKKGGTTFANLPEDADDEARTRRTTEELKAMGKE